MRYVLLYESGPDVASLAPIHGAAHVAHWKAFVEAGTLVAVGPFANPARGAMAIFTTREAAESFAKDDPFVLNGVVARYTIDEWMEALGATP